MTTRSTSERPAPLQDTCDRCQARAYVRAVLPRGGELLFCAHHARRYADALRQADAALEDEAGVLAALNQSVN
jgi:hypothetical protein